MKHPRLILLIIFTLIFGVSAFAQRKFSGTVVEIVDGKTVVVEMPTGGKITVELQYIEVPEPEQQLSQTVKEHLQQMVFGKQVEFLPRGVTESKTIGQLFVGGVDVSQQMLRDGAAWHMLPEKSGQEEVQRDLYQTNEAQAKAEKRGVWSIENLQPAWEFRARKEETRLQQQTAELEKVRSQNQNQNQTVSNSRNRRLTPEEQMKANAGVQMWNDARSANATDANRIFTYTTSNETAAGGLVSSYFSSMRAGYTSTPDTPLVTGSGKANAVLHHRTFYVYKGDQASGIERDIFVISIGSVAPSDRFAAANSLTIIADNQKFAFTKLTRIRKVLPKGTVIEGVALEGVVEVLYYKASPAALKKIANAKNVQVKIGQYSGTMSSDTKTTLKDLLEATN